MPDALFQAGYRSTTSSNCAGIDLAGRIGASLHGGQRSGNIARVGHRRWLLNPPLKEIGFGFASKRGVFSVAQVFDRNRSTPFWLRLDCGRRPPQDRSRSNSSMLDRWGRQPATLPGATGLSNHGRDEAPLGRNDLANFIGNGSSAGRPGGRPSLFSGRYAGGPGVGNWNHLFRPNRIEAFVAGDRYQVRITGIPFLHGSPANIEYTVRFFQIILIFRSTQIEPAGNRVGGFCSGILLEIAGNPKELLARKSPGLPTASARNAHDVGQRLRPLPKLCLPKPRSARDGALALREIRPRTFSRQQ